MRLGGCTLAANKVSSLRRFLRCRLSITCRQWSLRQMKEESLKGGRHEQVGLGQWDRDRADHSWLPDLSSGVLGWQPGDVRMAHERDGDRGVQLPHVLSVLFQHGACGAP